MKILYYNWIQFDNEKKIGGGVNIYQYNLIDSLNHNKNFDVFFLSAGSKYNPFITKPYIKKTKNVFRDKCKTFEIINSPIMAPAFCMYMNTKKIITDQISYKMLKKFCMKYGPFDVIHFNNIEGISVNALQIKKDFPKTKIIISIHNYQPICPLVQYFQNHTQKICHDFKNGNECLKCAVILPKKEYQKKVETFLLEKNFPKYLTHIIKKLFKFRRKKYIGKKKNISAEDYKRYREHNIHMINKYADKVLAVSDRVKQIMISHGISNTIIKTSYIGTKFANNELNHSIAPKDDILTICYLGYPRVDKGYYFLLDGLSKLPDHIKTKINVTLAVANINEGHALNNLKGFNKINIYNGYNHDNIKQILKDVHLGIIPVLWEDNLPQVAIEMVASGVPILCSSFGGASELCRDKNFKFTGGNIDSFIEHLTYFINNPEKINTYWENHPKLTTMEQHIEELEKIYIK